MLLQNLRQEEHAVKSTEAQGGIEKGWKMGFSAVGVVALGD